MFVRHKIRALIDVDPAAARKVILDAYVKARCHIGDAAELLGCRRHAFTRWAVVLGMEDSLLEVAERAKREGWHHGRVGGGGLHRDPQARIRNVRRAWRAKRERAATVDVEDTA